MHDQQPDPLRLMLALAVLLLALQLAGCTRSIDLRPGRDAYYQVTTQLVPAQASGSHSQQASLASSAPGDAIYPPSQQGMKGTTCAPSLSP